MAVEDSESRRFEWKHLAEFFSGRSWPNICPGFFFSFFFQSLELVFSRGVLTASGTARFKLFWQHRVSIVIGLTTSTLRWAFSRYARYFEQPAQPGDHGTLVLGGFFIFRGCTTTLYISIISLAALFLWISPISPAINPRMCVLEYCTSNIPLVLYCTWHQNSTERRKAPQHYSLV